MESVDRLREYATAIDPWPASRDRIEQIADAIEAEVAERYAPLLVGKDAKPIRPGDTVYGSDGHEWRVTYLRIGRNHSVRATDGTESKALRPEWLSHEKPLIVEDLLWKCCNEYHSLLIESMSDMPHEEIPAPSEVINRYAAKLCLAGGDK